VVSHRPLTAILLVGAPALSLVLAVTLSLLLQALWPLGTAPILLAAGPGLAAGLGRVSLKSIRLWASVVSTVGFVVWAAVYYWLSSDGYLQMVLGCVLAPVVVVVIAAVAVGIGLSFGAIPAHWRATRWRAVQPLASYAAVAALIVLLPATGIAPAHRNSDVSMIDNFRSHESEFERIVEMSGEDSKVVRIAPDFTWLEGNAAWPRPSSMIGFDEARWNEYRRLFSQTGVREGIIRHGGRISFLYWLTGMVTGGQEKGYVYSTEPLSPLFESLDHIPDVKSGDAVYRRIAGNWYLYYQWDD
jgi:hypothetical protein